MPSKMNFKNVKRSLCLALAVMLITPLSSCGVNYIDGLRFEETEEDKAELLSPLIISQVYGTGHKSDAVLRHSYIQLYNTSDESVSLDGASLYVKSGKAKEYEEFHFPSSESIAAHGYYLIRGAEAEEINGTEYDAANEILRIDKYDLAADSLLLDNRENTLLIGASGLRPSGKDEPDSIEGISTYFIGTENEGFKYHEIHTAEDMSKNKIAVKTGNLKDSYYNVINLTKAGTADLISCRPQTSEGDVNTYVASKLNEVKFSHYAGYYDEDFELTLEAPEGYTVYYTTDGSDPTIESAVYTEPLEIKDTSDMLFGPQVDRGIRYFGDGAKPTMQKMLGGRVIKAMASNGEESTDVYTNTYFVIKDFDLNYDALVFSFSMYERDWISAEGFYNRFGDSDPRPRSEGYLEVFDNDGNRVGHSNVEVGVSGKYSASKLMKSLRVYYKGSLNDGKEGQNQLNYTLFGDDAYDSAGGVISEYERLLLRNGGNDCGLSYVRDAFSQRLGKMIGIDGMAYKPALVFINGEFWGMYNCRERYETQYFSSHYGVAEENVTVMESDYSKVFSDRWADYVVSDGNPADGRNFNDLYHYIRDNDLSNHEAYEYVCERLDIDSVINMYVEHLILGAADWPFNNIKLWRNSNPNDPSGMDTKWRFVQLDQDTSLGLSHSYTSASCFPDAFNMDSTAAVIMTKLMENEEFRNRFYLRYYYAATEVYTKEAMTEMFWEVYDSVKPLIKLQAMRWPGDGANMTTWESQMEIILTFLQNRPDYTLSTFYDYFDIDEEYILNLKEKEEQAVAEHQLTEENSAEEAE